MGPDPKESAADATDTLGNLTQAHEVIGQIQYGDKHASLSGLPFNDPM
jgi:hypothetical protein